MMVRFKDLSNPDLKNVYVIKDTETGETLNSIPLLLLKLNELNDKNKELEDKLNDCRVLKNRFKEISNDAFCFLNCYEKAINDLTQEYKYDKKVMFALDKLEEYYSRYENEVI